MNNQLIIYSPLKEYFKFNENIMIFSKFHNLDNYDSFAITILFNVYIYYLTSMIMILY